MFKGDSRDFGESFGERRGEWEGRGKILKERELSVRFEDDPRPSAPGMEGQWFTFFPCKGWLLSLGLHSQAPTPSRQRV